MDHKRFAVTGGTVIAIIEEGIRGDEKCRYRRSNHMAE